jgi:glutamine synthetase
MTQAVAVPWRRPERGRADRRAGSGTPLCEAARFLASGGARGFLWQIAPLPGSFYESAGSGVAAQGGIVTAEPAIRLSGAEDARRFVEEGGHPHVKLGVTDIDGILRGKYVSRDKFFSALEKGFGFCDVIVGWDSNDQLYDNVTYTGWHTAYPDAPVRILPETARIMPFEGGMPFFLCELAEKAEAICPRGLLRRVLAKAGEMGFSVSAALEYEFFLFDETPDSVREKGYRNLKPMTPGFFGYSVLRSSVHAEFYRELLDTCRAMDMALEGLHTETGPGVLEAAIAVDDALRAADKAVLFKTFTKVIAQRCGRMATFMAKWSRDWPGQSGHIHLSLKDKSGKPVFHDAKAERGMSQAMRHFIGGQQKLMPEFLAMVASTVNSYSRLIPGFWAPTSATWGIENRTTALRAIPGSPSSQRVEYRIAAADANPYVALAAALASGLWGIENEVEPDAPIPGNAYEAKLPRKLDLPRTLWEAAQRLKGSKVARALFGDEFVDHFAATREWEEREFRKAITDWELARYFEII